VIHDTLAKRNSREKRNLTIQHMRKAVATCTKCKLNVRIEMNTLVYD